MRAVQLAGTKAVSLDWHWVDQTAVESVCPSVWHWVAQTALRKADLMVAHLAAPRVAVMVEKKAALSDTMSVAQMAAVMVDSLGDLLAVMKAW